MGHECDAGTRSGVYIYADAKSSVLLTCHYDIQQVNLVLEAFDVNDPSFQFAHTMPVTLPPNCATELFAGLLPGVPTLTKLSQVAKSIVVSAKLVDKDKDIISRNSNWSVSASSHYFDTASSDNNLIMHFLTGRSPTSTLTSLLQMLSHSALLIRPHHLPLRHLLLRITLMLPKRSISPAQLNLPSRPNARSRELYSMRKEMPTFVSVTKEST